MRGAGHEPTTAAARSAHRAARAPFRWRRRAPARALRRAASRGPESRAPRRAPASRDRLPLALAPRPARSRAPGSHRSPSFTVRPGLSHSSACRRSAARATRLAAFAHGVPRTFSGPEFLTVSPRDPVRNPGGRSFQRFEGPRRLVVLLSRPCLPPPLSRPTPAPGAWSRLGSGFAAPTAATPRPTRHCRPCLRRRRSRPGEQRLGDLAIEVRVEPAADVATVGARVRNRSDREVHLASVLFGFRWSGHAAQSFRFLRHGWQSWSFDRQSGISMRRASRNFRRDHGCAACTTRVGAPPRDRRGWHESDLVTAIGASPAGPACVVGVLERGRAFGVLYARRSGDARRDRGRAAPRGGARPRRSARAGGRSHRAGPRRRPLAGSLRRSPRPVRRGPRRASVRHWMVQLVPLLRGRGRGCRPAQPRGPGGGARRAARGRRPDRRRLPARRGRLAPGEREIPPRHGPAGRGDPRRRLHAGDLDGALLRRSRERPLLRAPRLDVARPRRSPSAASCTRSGLRTERSTCWTPRATTCSPTSRASSASWSPWGSTT